MRPNQSVKALLLSALPSWRGGLDSPVQTNGLLGPSTQPPLFTSRLRLSVTGHIQGHSRAPKPHLNLTDPSPSIFLFLSHSEHMKNVKEREIEINKNSTYLGTADNVQPCSQPNDPCCDHDQLLANES